MSKCEFTLRLDHPSETISHGVPDSVIDQRSTETFRCDRDVDPDKKYCPLHSAQANSSPEEAADLILSEIEDAAPAEFSKTKKFIGVRIGSLDLRELDVRPGDLDSVTLDFRFADIDGEFHLPEVGQGLEINLSGARIDRVSAGRRETKLRGLNLNGTTVGVSDSTIDKPSTDEETDRIILKELECNTIEIEKATIHGHLRCNDIRHTGTLTLSDSTISGNVNLEHIDVARFNARNTRVEGTTLISIDSVTDSALFQQIEIAQLDEFVIYKSTTDIQFNGATIHGEPEFQVNLPENEIDFTKSTFSDIEISGDGTQVETITFTDSTLLGNCALSDVSSVKELNLQKVNLSGTLEIQNCSIEDVVLKSTTVDEQIQIGDGTTISNLNGKLLQVTGTLEIGTIAYSEAISNHVLDQNNTRITTECTLSDAELGALAASGVQLGGKIDCNGMTADSITCVNTVFGANDPVNEEEKTELQTDWRELTVSEPSSFEHTTFRRSTSFKKSRFEDSANFSNCRFDSKVDFSEVRFEDRAKFLQRLSLESADGLGSDSTLRPIFGDDTYFIETIFEVPPEFRWKRNDGRTVNPLDFDSEFHTINGHADFTGASAKGSELEGFSAGKCTFEGADLTDANLHQANLEKCNLKTAILSRANLTEANLTDADLYGAVFGEARIDEETQIDNTLSTDPVPKDQDTNYLAKRYRGLRRFLGSAVGRRSSSSAEGTEKVRNAYKKLEQLATENGQAQSGRQWFINRREVARYEQRISLEDSTGFKQKGANINGYVWLCLQRYVIRYGEGPTNVVFASLGLIMLFGFIYPWGLLTTTEPGVTVSYQACCGNLTCFLLAWLRGAHFSALAFTTLGFGRFQPIGAGHWFAVLETGLGSVMMALLVFVFGRRATR